MKAIMGEKKKVSTKIMIKKINVSKSAINAHI